LRCVPTKRLVDGRTYGRRGARTVGGRRPAAALRWNSTATPPRSAAGSTRDASDDETHRDTVTTRNEARLLFDRCCCYDCCTFAGGRPVSPSPSPSRRARRHRPPPPILHVCRADTGWCTRLMAGCSWCSAGGRVLPRTCLGGGGCVECGSLKLSPWSP
jgi:hypothetical protein